MKRAIQLAAESVACGGGPFGALIVRNGTVVSEASNCVVSDHDPTAHAEVVAIRRACRNERCFELGEHELYTSCEPCPMCLAAIYWAHIPVVYYASTAQDAAHAGFDDQFIYEQFRLPLEGRQVRMIRLAPPEAILPFEAWQAKPDRTEY